MIYRSHRGAFHSPRVKVGDTASPPSLSPSKHLHNPISAAANNPPPILTPHNSTHTFPTHEAMTCDVLGTASFLQRPKSQASIMTSRDEFSAVGGKGEGRDGRRVCKHRVRALALDTLVSMSRNGETGGAYRYLRQRTEYTGPRSR